MIDTEIMEAQIGARRGEVSEARSTHRNGYRQRPWATSVGEIELAVPRKRSGESNFPSFLEPRKRSEKALLGVVMEAVGCVNPIVSGGEGMVGLFWPA